MAFLADIFLDSNELWIQTQDINPAFNSDSIDDGVFVDVASAK